MGYWTMDNVLGLKGVPGDPENPPLLSDAHILFALEHSRVARTEFNNLLPTLLPEEQERLNFLVSSNPRLRLFTQEDQQFSDNLQRRDITSTAATAVRLSRPQRVKR